MKKKRTIIIKNPRLRRIRDNFRTLILKASRSIQHEAMNKKELISKKIVDAIGNIELYHKQGRELEKRIQEIDRQLYASIILCPSCLKWDKDMTYNPIRKKWYCIECYEILKKGFTEEGHPEEFP